VGDIMANAPRTMGMLEAGAEAQGASLAIVGSDYLNLSLRMGYHFSVVDAFLGPQQSRNYVYFRFAGGLATGKRRERRARLIGQILESMDFMVMREGDLVVGRLKPDDDRAIRAAVEVLGSLTAYFRQLDTVMRDEEDVTRISHEFTRSFMQAFAVHGGTMEDAQAAPGRP
jgi:pyruvate,water dikinase